MKTFLLTALLFLSADIFAREIKLATITGNADTDTSVFLVELNAKGHLDTIRFTTTTREGRITQDSHFPAETVDATGVVLLERDGRKILKLETVKPFSFENGGTVKLNHLYSGVTNTWKSVNVLLVKSGEDFEIRTLDGKKITKFFVKGNFHRIFGLIGISTLVPQP